MNDKRKYTQAQQRIIDEIRRIADSRGQTSLSKREFDEHHQLGGVSTAGYQFGSWNEAVEAAGLIPHPSGGVVGKQISNRELLKEIILVYRRLGRQPPERKFARMGRYSLQPYRDRWGSFSKAREAAYALFGEPNAEKPNTSSAKEE